MGINAQKIKKWTNMMLGNSSYHVNQDEGKIYSKEHIEGYYNNLTEKVSKFGLPGNTIPVTTVDSGEKIFFSIAIFQYGLAAYDLILLNNGRKEDLVSKVLACADWAVDNQQADGSWITFSYENPEHPYSSMAQGEGISLLLRAYKLDNNEKYLDCAKKAKRFMLLPIEDGGTTQYCEEDIYFFECTHEPLILNGWIFSIWGLMDYNKQFKEKEVEEILRRTLSSLEKTLPQFDTGYWSKYENGMRISSPFYHNLHVAQLHVMYELTNSEVFNEYAKKWDSYSKNWVYSKKAFIIKAFQKVFKE